MLQITLIRLAANKSYKLRVYHLLSCTRHKDELLTQSQVSNYSAARLQRVPYITGAYIVVHTILRIDRYNQVHENTP